MTLSDPRVQQCINQYYVAALYSFDESSDETDRALFAPIRAARQKNRAEHPGDFIEGPEGTIVILTPKGEFVGESNIVTYVNEPLHLLNDLERFARQLGAKPGEKPGEFVLQPPTPPGQDDLVMRVTSRFLFHSNFNRTDVNTPVDPNEPLKAVDYTFRPARRGNRNHIPAQDWVVLKPEAWRLLVPADKMKVGQSYDIDPKLAGELLMHFSAPVFSGPLSPDNIREKSMTALVSSSEGDRLTIQVKGAVTMTHRWMAVQEDKHPQYIKAEVVGYIEYDTAAQRIRDVRLVTTDANYHGAPPPYVHVFPYGAAMYTVTGDTPTWMAQTASR